MSNISFFLSSSNYTHKYCTQVEHKRNQIQFYKVAFGFEDLKSRDLRNNCYYKFLIRILTTHDEFSFENFTPTKHLCYDLEITLHSVFQIQIVIRLKPVNEFHL
jgi:hypothetical protein